MPYMVIRAPAGVTGDGLLNTYWKNCRDWIPSIVPLQ